MLKPRKKRGMTAGITEMFDIPGEGIAGEAKLTLTGSRRVHIENHRGLLEYSETLISVNCGDIIIAVTGSGLELQSMNEDEVLIRGDILRLEIS